jgi:hypothetical protein
LHPALQIQSTNKDISWIFLYLPRFFALRGRGTAVLVVLAQQKAHERIGKGGNCCFTTPFLSLYNWPNNCELLSRNGNTFNTRWQQIKKPK